MNTKLLSEQIIIFIRFLKENNAYVQYLKNYYMKHTIDINAFLQNINPDKFVERAFLYEATIEKYIFWHQLSLKWRTIIIK